MNLAKHFVNHNKLLLFLIENDCMNSLNSSLSNDNTKREDFLKFIFFSAGGISALERQVNWSKILPNISTITLNVSKYGSHE